MPFRFLLPLPSDEIAESPQLSATLLYEHQDDWPARAESFIRSTANLSSQKSGQSATYAESESLLPSRAKRHQN